MRGKEAFPKFLHVLIGITPAYAGKSRLCARGLPRVRDHPRVCGEKFLEVVQPIAQWGSPPRMRGKGREPETLGPAYRITPAYAGKRKVERVCGGRGEDHPRVCGEKSLCDQLSLEYEGSPPRMRGKEL